MDFNNFILTTCFLFCYFSSLHELPAQVGIGTNAPEASAVLDLSSTHQGFLPPRMTLAEMKAIANPAEGLLLYCTDCAPQGLYYFDGSYFLNSKSGAISGNLALFDGSSLTHNGTLDSSNSYTATDDITTSIAFSGWTGDAPHNPLSVASSGRLGYTATLIPFTPSVGVLEDGTTIPDSQLSASTTFVGFSTSDGRLNRLGLNWAAGILNTSQWFQVDLGQTETVVGVATQGRQDDTQWINTYRIQYSNDASSFTDYDGGAVLTGNIDQNTVVRNDFNPTFTARYVRFLPQSWNIHMSARFEVYIQPSATTSSNGIANFQITGKAVASSGPDPIFNVSIGGQELLFSREVSSSVPVVFVAAGVEDGTIPDSQLSASGSFTTYFPADGRLNQAGQNWAAAALNTSQWFQVDLGQIETVTAVATQGREDAAQWITSYKIQYSTNGSSFTDYAGGLTFNGNSDRNTIVRNAFSSTFSARYVRFLPQTWSGFISGRFEVYIQ